MPIDENKIDTITDAASVFMTPPEIAVLCDITENEFLELLNDTSSEVHTAYLKGKTIAKYNHRKRIVDIALKGSASAQELVEKFIIEQSKAERDGKA